MRRLGQIPELSGETMNRKQSWLECGGQREEGIDGDPCPGGGHVLHQPGASGKQDVLEVRGWLRFGHAETAACGQGLYRSLIMLERRARDAADGTGLAGVPGPHWVPKFMHLGLQDEGLLSLATYGQWLPPETPLPTCQPAIHRARSSLCAD